MLGLVLPLALALPARARTETPGSITAEQAMENYRDVFAPTRTLDCPRPADPEEIVVCARPRSAPDPNRLPLAVAREPGARVAGEVPSGRASMNADSCLRLCPQPVMVDVIAAARFVKNTAERLANGE